MKLESLNSKKFKSLKKEELNKVNGGNAYLSALTDCNLTIVWTKSSKSTDESCDDDCD